ncbi:4a-hydroxytetrahydrobiopterin dehydratase [Yinghuangia seranimata]|uniref:4a-hydroxytetrahydrobiopterin dehydratase n=1 Tax=Yinghuangia seranimata TaxID=408067 RepID=UPI00248ADBA7|nr:4a-hydroxytetrahydrobiopterin dehydratase [Yinghuangia seranimata]MDI2128899.1 4a-hydroxytetrahydrobiopterin dehydratase [Yinghuangia seranimata]
MPELFDAHALTTALADLDGWKGDTDLIQRTVSAPDFPTAIRIVDAIAVVAEEMNHHPDIDIRWRNLLIGLTTHDAGGVTDLDVTLARRIDAIAKEHGA